MELICMVVITIVGLGLMSYVGIFTIKTMIELVKRDNEK